MRTFRPTTVAAAYAVGIVVTMAYKAGRMLAPSAFPFPVAESVKDAQARAWIAQFRDGPGGAGPHPPHSPCCGAPQGPSAPSSAAARSGRETRGTDR